MLIHVAMALQGIALALMMALMLLPGKSELYAAVIVSLLLLTPAGGIFKGQWWRTVRFSFCYGVCIYILAFSNLIDYSRDSLTTRETALMCAVGWTFFLTSVESGGFYGFPVAMLTCLSSALTLSEETGVRSALIITSISFLLISGGVIFVESLTHPSIRASRIAKHSFHGLSPQMLIALVSLILMFSTTDTAQTLINQYGSLIPIPENNSDNQCNLVSAPPEFNGKTICSLSSLKGPLPRYIADRIFYEYKKGSWVNGFPSFENRLNYGIITKSSVQHFGATVIKMADKKAPMLVPFGSTFQEADRKKTKTKSVQTFRWLRFLPPTKHDIPLAETEIDMTKLKRLAIVSRTICADTSYDDEKINRVIGYMQRELTYDMNTPFKPDSNSVTDPIDQFLFQRKRGWCIHFASAAALMLRSVDIPTRMVTGYAVITARNVVEVPDNWGHAWCEALIKDRQGKKHWVIVDPAAASVGTSVAITSQFPVRKIAGALAIIIVLSTVFMRSRKVNVKDLMHEIEQEGGNLTDAEKVEHAYRRCLTFFRRMGLEKPSFLPPGSFARKMVPPEHRSPFTTITNAYEKISYMGYIELGSDIDDVTKAQCSILEQKNK